MDAPRGLNSPGADKALRDLFHESGLLSAPEGLDARVLQRISVTAQPVRSTERPLLPRWVWAAGASAVVAIALIPGEKTGTMAPWAQWIPTIHFDTVLSSPWVLLALATGACLLALDTYLGKRHHAHQPR